MQVFWSQNNPRITLKTMKNMDTASSNLLLLLQGSVIFSLRASFVPSSTKYAQPQNFILDVHFNS